MIRTLAVIGMVWVGMAGVMDTARAAKVVQYATYHGRTHYVMDMALINDDPGAIYNSAELDAALLGGLAEQLWQLPVNPHHYDTIEAMMADWGLGVMPSGNVDNGWGATLGGGGPDALPLGQVVLTNNGLLPGITYDQWTSSAGQNTMALTLRIPLSQLEVDGLGGYAPDRDAQLVLTDATLQQAFVAMSTTGFTIWSNAAYLYGVVWPEVDCAAANVSGSGTVGLADVAQVAAMWLETGLFLPEDITKDGRVDLDDLAALARCWGVAIEY